ncbi:MAG: hypothetical protein M5R40_27905 [Anaerolineae bacterium]|nr:hypothetical protein [Anaerolineae bacterium]
MADDWLSDEWNEDDLPEWLRGADEAPEEPAASEPPESAEQPPAPEDEEALPGWLTGAEPGAPAEGRRAGRRRRAAARVGATNRSTG